MKKRQRSTEFACYVRNYTVNALCLEPPFGSLEAAPKMTQAQYAALLNGNRERYAASRGTPRPAATSPDMSPPDATAASPAQAATTQAPDDWRS
jgi:hypothetical protein